MNPHRPSTVIAGNEYPTHMGAVRLRLFTQVVRAVVLIVSGALASGMSAALAQVYPNKPVRMVTGGIGGGIDFVTRILGQGIAGSSGQQVIVDNRASGAVPREIVSRAPPDGYTLLVAGSTLWIGALIQKADFDTLRDLTTVSLVTSQPSILVVNPAVPVKSVKDLIALAKARPGELNYASASTGAASHLAAELFKSMAGVNIVRVTYKSGAARQTDLLSGQVQLSFATASSLESHVKSGKLRALAVTSLRPSPLFPDLPTVAASGLPGYDSVTINAVFAPPRTPAAAVGLVNQAIVRALGRADVKEKYLNGGLETAGSSPAALAAAIKAEMTTLGKLLKDIGIGDNE